MSDPTKPSEALRLLNCNSALCGQARDQRERISEDVYRASLCGLHAAIPEAERLERDVVTLAVERDGEAHACAELRAERDRYKAALEGAAADNCQCPKVGLHPCGTCIARQALEAS